MFKREDYDTKKHAEPAGGRRLSMMESDRKHSLSSSMSDLRPPSMYSIPPINPTTPSVSSPDYWTTVSSFIGSFLKRYHSKHSMELKRDS